MNQVLGDGEEGAKQRKEERSIGEERKASAKPDRGRAQFGDTEPHLQ